MGRKKMLLGWQLRDMNDRMVGQEVGIKNILMLSFVWPFDKNTVINVVILWEFKTCCLVFTMED